MKTIGLFFTVFFAVFFANIASNLASAAFMVSGFQQFADDLKGEFIEPTQQLSPGLAQDIQRLHTNQAAAEQLPDKLSIEKQRAFENDVKLCKSWRKTYLKDGDELSKMYMETACKRAYGN